MSKMRNIRTYRVTDHRSADDVANAAIGCGSKVVSMYALQGRNQTLLVGVAVLHSLNVMDKAEKGEGNPMIQAMNRSDRDLNH